MWKYLNSPIVITLIAIAALFIFAGTMKPRLATEIRAAYEELNKIIQDGASDAEKTKAIQQFAKEMATQMRTGFSEGFKSEGNLKEDEMKIFADTKSKIVISNIKSAHSEWKNSEKIIYKIKNGSNRNISSLRVNYEYYKQGELIDCSNQWINEIKMLVPNEEAAISQTRQLGNDPNEVLKSDEVKIKVSSFEIKPDHIQSSL
jgi:hypothetical protein